MPTSVPANGTDGRPSCAQSRRRGRIARRPRTEGAMRRMQLGLVLVTVMLPTAAPASAAPLQFSAVMQPQISGHVNAPRVGETLTEISAVWSRAPKSFEYRWLDCAPGQSIDQCRAIPGATGRSYTLQASDAGLYVVVAETGHD